MKFKSDKDKDLFFCLHPALILIFADLNWYAKYKHGVDLVITQTISSKIEDIALKRVSKAHRNAIAIDVRTKDLDVFVVEDIKNYINNKDEYQKYKYLANSGKKRLAYYHIGSEEHLHIALHSKFAIKSK